MSGMKIKINRSLLKTPTAENGEPTEASVTIGKKRSRADSDSDDEDRDFEDGSLPSGPARSRPKRKSAAGVDELLSSLANDESDDSEYESRSKSGEEPVSMRTSSKAKARRRIDSDEEGDPSPEPEVPSKTTPKPQKGRGLSSMTAKQKPVKDADVKIQARDQRRLPPADKAGPSTPQTGDTDEPVTKRKKVPLPTKRPSQPMVGNGTPTLIKKSSSRPSVVPPASGDLDLSSMDAMRSLLQSTRNQASNEQKTIIYEDLRAEARKARQAAAHETFDLMAGGEKIKAFECEMERLAIWPLPQFLAAPFTVPRMMQ